MTGHPLIDVLARHGVTISVQSDRLDIDAPPGIVTPEALQIIGQHKAGILAALSGSPDIAFRDDIVLDIDCNRDDDIDFNQHLDGPHTPDTCPRCGSPEHVDISIHDGQSVRRDCAECGRMFGFPVWYGEEHELHK